LKIAILSDIHSNYAALEACYDYIKNNNVNGIIYLGDYVSDCPYPQRTMLLIKEMSKQFKSWFIVGNREEYIIKHHENPNDGWKYSSRSGSLLYTYENLTKSDIEFFKACKSIEKIQISDCLPLLVCHGSPASSKEQLLYGSDVTNNYLKNLETRYLICGHSHKQFSYSFNGKTLINPGSVGLQTNKQIKARFAILVRENDEWASEFVNINYDVDRILQDFESSGINEKAKIWSRAIYRTLQTGVNYSYMLVKLVRKLALEKDNNQTDGNVELWEKAGKELGIV
jgi:putative phosphoesterase